MCKQFTDFVYKHTKQKPSVYKHKNIFSVQLSASLTTMITGILYKDSETYLDRKYNLWLKSLK